MLWNIKSKKPNLLYGLSFMLWNINIQKQILSSILYVMEH